MACFKYNWCSISLCVFDVIYRPPIFSFSIHRPALSNNKDFFIAFITIKQLSTLVKLCHSFERLFWIFGLIISICVFSFATDYNCLFQFDQSSFEGIIGESKTYIHNLYQFLYFSIITFSSVGYGDIAPLSGVARSVVMLEIFLSYLIIVFALANIKNMHINE